jgi:putative endonuclease
LFVQNSEKKSGARLQLGQSGELLVQKYCVGLGWQIKARNWRSHHWEIDLIAYDPRHHELVAVEVKTRTSDRFGSPSLAVKHGKIRSVRLAMGQYCRQHHYFGPWRIDVIAVLPDTIEHFENITW